MAAQFLHMRPRPLFAIVGLVIVGLAVWVLIDTESIPLLAALAFVVLWFALIPWRARRQFREYKALTESFSMEVRDDGVFFERERSSGLIPWSHLVQWRANSSMVLLYPARNLFYLVPKRCFRDPQEFALFQAELAERVGRAV